MSTFTTTLRLTKPEITDCISPDMFASDFDKIDAAISSITVTIPASGWSASAPYEQTVGVTGMTEDWIPGIPSLISTGVAETDIACREALSYVHLITSSSGALTFTCYEDVPTESFSIRIPRLVSGSIGTIALLRNVYYGTAALPEEINPTFIQTLSYSLEPDRAKTFTVTANSEEYIWYAFPASYGTPIFMVSGVEGGFMLAATIEHTESYYVYRSVQPSLGAETVVVS